MIEASPIIVTYRIGRDAITGKFISVAEAERRPETTVIETIRRVRPRGGTPLAEDR